MIDDDDALVAAILWPDSGKGKAGCLLALLGLVVVITFLAIASQNKAECAQMKCPSGAPAELLKHECLCVEKPK